MTLFEQWKDLIENQTEETFRDFWEEYSGAETKIYSDILDKPEEKMTGTLGELAAKYEVRPVIFMGFLDGINSSLKKGNDFGNSLLQYAGCRGRLSVRPSAVDGHPGRRQNQRAD